MTVAVGETEIAAALQAVKADHRAEVVDAGGNGGAAHVR